MMSRKDWSIYALLALCLTKFWLIWPYEITDEYSDPLVYIAQVANPLVGACYGPGTGLFGNLFYQLHVPYRLGLELCLQLALFLQVGVLLGWPHRSWLGLAAFALALFNPNLAELSSHLLSDPVWALLVMTGLSLWVEDCRESQGLRLLVPAFSCLFLATLTRSSAPPLEGAFLAFLALTLGLSWLTGQTRSHRPLVRNLVISTLLLMLWTGLPYWIWCRISPYQGISTMDCRPYLAFYLTLQSVGSDGGTPYCPIDEKRRALIAQAGPVSAKLIHDIDSNPAVETNFKQTGVKYYGVHDIPCGWFPFTVLAVVSPRVPEEFKTYAAIEAEIHQAQKEGRIPQRFVLPLPDSRLGLVCSLLPRELGKSVAPLLYQPPHYAYVGMTPAFSQADFTKFLTRRNVQPDTLHAVFTDGLCSFYYFLYQPPLLVFFFGSVIACPILLILRRKEFQELPPELIPQQIFLCVLAIFFVWYVIFAASGLFIFNRYLVYHNLMLPLLTLYYARLSWHLYKRVPYLIKRDKIQH
jgi:hypothetical protein